KSSFSWSVARRGCYVALLAAAGLAGFAPSAFAQQYQVDKVDDTLAKQGETIKGMAKDPTKYVVADFDNYFTNYYFPVMPRADADEMGKLGSRRYELFNRIVWPSPNEELQSHLTDMAFERMKTIAADPAYHPAVRYNAILIVGMLDAKYAIPTGANQRPP